MQPRLWAILFALLALSGTAHAQGKSIDNWPIPTTGSTYLSNGDRLVASRSGTSYQLLAGFGGTCPSNQWTSSINSQGQPGCTQPALTNLSGFLNLNQLAGSYTNGQLLIGNTSTGLLQSGTIASGTNIVVTNSAGGISVATAASPAFTNLSASGSVGIGTTSPSHTLDVRGLVSENGVITNGTTFTVASGCGTVGSVTGGATGGSFTAGATSCVPVMTLPTAPNGWICTWTDITTPADTIKQTTPVSTTGCTGTGTVVSADVILFNAVKAY